MGGECGARARARERRFVVVVGRDGDAEAYVRGSPGSALIVTWSWCRPCRPRRRPDLDLSLWRSVLWSMSASQFQDTAFASIQHPPIIFPILNSSRTHRRNLL